VTVRTTWRGPEALLREAETVLTEILPEPVNAASLVREDDASSEPSDAAWALHAYTEEPLSADDLAMLPGGLEGPEIEELEDRDWVAHSLEGLGKVRAGPFVLFGHHDAAKVAPEDGIPLQVEANQAFGTGHHPTTAGCLDVLGDLRDTGPHRILDLGCGSGILAMAARKLWPHALIVATDLDAPSIRIAQENAGINVTPDIHFAVADGVSSPLIRDHAPFDLVLANILAGPLRELAPGLAAVTHGNGTIVLAGLLDEQQVSVEESYRGLGFSVRSVDGTPRWPVLTLTREPEAPQET
jgi:ribosomal protein L11 methyltransferase